MMKKIFFILVIFLIPNLSLALEFKKIKKEAVVTNSKIIFPIKSNKDTCFGSQLLQPNFTLDPILTLDAPKGYGLDDRFDRVRQQFERFSMPCGLGDVKSCKKVKEIILNWAKADAPKRTGPKNGESKFWNDTLTINLHINNPMMSAYSFASQVIDFTLEEEKIICSSDLYDFSYDINFYDAQIYDENKILLSYWDYQIGDERKNLIVDIESGEISEDANKSFFAEDNRMNVYGEKLIDPWETSDYNSRVIGVYYADRIKNIEVFSSRAPSSYYFESFHWSPDGNNIIAGDSENNLIIFSKNKSFNPLKIEINTNLQDGDKLELVQVLGWTN